MRISRKQRSKARQHLQLELLKKDEEITSQR